jgi:mannose-6-phosphate isomerase-like protein (cupin superfamily)
MQLIDWKSALAGSAYDAAVGISIAKLTGDDTFATYLAEIAPGKSVRPHYHRAGDEHYHIVAGCGQIRLSSIDGGLTCVEAVHAGISFVVPENTVHELINTGDTALLLMFSCAADHLADDRRLL